MECRTWSTLKVSSLCQSILAKRMSLSLHLSEWKSKASKKEQLLKYGTFKIFQFPVKISKSDDKHAHEHTSLPSCQCA